MTTPKHTPGPWVWRWNERGKEMSLRSGGHTSVMEFRRVGMQSAQPWFRDGFFIKPGSEFAHDIPGQEHNASWLQAVEHPDARLIAAAPLLLEACEAAVEVITLDDAEKDHPSCAAVDLLRAAIAAARGEP